MRFVIVKLLSFRDNSNNRRVARLRAVFVLTRTAMLVKSMRSSSAGRILSSEHIMRRSTMRKARKHWLMRRYACDFGKWEVVFLQEKELSVDDDNEGINEQGVERENCACVVL